MTEQGYLASLRQDVVRSTLTGSLAGPVAVPATLVDAIYRYRNEERRGHYVAVGGVLDHRPAAAERGRARGVPRGARGRVHDARVSPADLRHAGRRGPGRRGRGRRERRSRPSIRPGSRPIGRPSGAPSSSCWHPMGRDREGGRSRWPRGRASTRWRETLSAEGVSADDLGAGRPRPICRPAPAEAIFALAEGEVSQPVESPFGWHLFRLTEILPEEVVPLAEARDEIARELALAEARERLPDFATQLDDELAAGLSLAEAAAAVGLEAKSVAALDARGNDPEGERPADLPDWPEFLRRSPSRPRRARPACSRRPRRAATSCFRSTRSCRPGSSRSTRSARSWSRPGRPSKRRELARQRAEDLLAQLRDGASLDELAVAEKLTVTPIEPVTPGRDGRRSGHQPGGGAGAVRDPAGPAGRPGGRARRQLRGGRDRRGDRRRPGRRSGRRWSGSRPSSKRTCGTTCSRSSRPSCVATTRSRSTPPRSTA